MGIIYYGKNKAYEYNYYKGLRKHNRQYLKDQHGLVVEFENEFNHNIFLKLDGRYYIADTALGVKKLLKKKKVIKEYLANIALTELYERFPYIHKRLEYIVRVRGKKRHETIPWRVYLVYQYYDSEDFLEWYYKDDEFRLLRSTNDDKIEKIKEIIF